MATFSIVNKFTIGCGLLFSLGVANTANAAAINEGFETGDLTGWTVVNQTAGSGDWFNTGGGNSPVSGFGIPAPTEGKKYAVTDQFGPGSHVLFQDISLEIGFEYTLSFDWFAQADASFANPGTMSYFGEPNQQFRVDLVPISFTNWFDSSSSIGILANILAPVAQGNEWNNTTFDLTPWAGSTVRLAFREVDNQSYFQAGVDDVKIASLPTPTPTKTPESSTAGGLLVLGLGWLVKGMIR